MSAAKPSCGSEKLMAHVINNESSGVMGVPTVTQLPVLCSLNELASSGDTRYNEPGQGTHKEGHTRFIYLVYHQVSDWQKNAP